MSIGCLQPNQQSSSKTNFEKGVNREKAFEGREINQKNSSQEYDTYKKWRIRVCLDYPKRFLLKGHWIAAYQPLFLENQLRREARKTTRKSNRQKQ